MLVREKTFFTRGNYTSNPDLPCIVSVVMCYDTTVFRQTVILFMRIYLDRSQAPRRLNRCLIKVSGMRPANGVAL